MSEVFAGRMGYDRPVDGGTRARRAPVPFDPSMPEAGRCRRWLSAGLRDRGIPPDSRLDLALRPHGEVSVARLHSTSAGRTPTANGTPTPRVLIPLRRLRGPGWPGWPADQAAVNLLRLLD